MFFVEWTDFNLRILTKALKIYFAKKNSRENFDCGRFSKIIP